MATIEIKVFANDVSLASNRRLFDRIVTVNDSCSIPFETIIRAMSFLYGDGTIINIQIRTK